MLGASALQRLYRAAITASEVSIDFEKNIALPSNDAVEEGYIGYLPGNELLKIVSVFDAEGDIMSLNKSVFFDNIRDYNPGSKINREISDTLSSGSGNDFIFRNNGVTVVAKSIKRTANKFRIQDFQVANGCQTSNILFNNREYVSEVSVPFRLIGTKDEDFIFSIISGTNKQNAVRPEQFWSLLPFMKNLEEVCRTEPDFRRIFLERRENQYRSENVERARIVQMQPLYKAITATLLAQPHKAARNYKSEIQERISELFEEGCDVRPAYAIAYLHYRLEFLWRNQRVPLGTKLYRFYIMDAVSRVILNDRDYLALGKKERVDYANDIVSFAATEEKLIAVVQFIAEKMEEQVIALGLADSREKLRDTIRSDQFAKSIRDQPVPV